MVKIISAAEFEKEVLKSDVPVLLDFYADWCPPCKALAPELDKLSALAGGQLKIVKLNVDNLKPGDEAAKLMQQRNIRSIPTMLMMSEGKVVAQEVGYKNVAQLQKWAESTFKITLGGSAPQPGTPKP